MTLIRISISESITLFRFWTDLKYYNVVLVLGLGFWKLGTPIIIELLNIDTSHLNG